MSAENKVTMTRVIVGVASVGATLALVYLYNKYQERKSKKGGAMGGSRVRRQSSKSGEVKKVTFKESHGDGSQKERDKLASSCGAEAEAASESNSKFRNELNNQKDHVSLTDSVVRHDAAVVRDDKLEGDGGQAPATPPSSSNRQGHDEGASLSGAGAAGKKAVPELASSTAATDDESHHGSSSNNTTNNYENNSTLKLEDSTITTCNTTTIHDNSTITPTPSVVRAPVVVEEVISRSTQGPLMTSTPLPGKEASGHKSFRAASAVFEPHASDLQSSAQGDAGKGVSPEDYDASTFRKEMRIPREIVSALIGKKGCNIKGIQAQSGTTINFHDQTLENGDRMCVIRGAPGNVTVAESLIEKFIIEQPTVYTEMLTVPTASVGRIIGRGGETIRSIQDLSKARVIVESHNHYGTGDSGPTRSITIKGSEEQINIAKQLIIEKVDEERNLRKSIDVATANRTHRRGGGASPSFPSPPGPTPTSATPNSASIEPVLPLKQDGILEVFVSCVYHPNDFWIQVVGRDSIELDKLCESMTDYYSGRHNEQGEPQYNVGDIVAAPFEVDGKIYRAKIMRIDDKGAEVSYLDYGDRRVLPLSEIYELHSNFLQLRFQAIQATLNLGCIGEKWEDDVINEFCDLTYCAQWQSLTARVKDYLKDVEDGHDVIWIELLDKETNIGEELVRKGLATPKGPSGCNGAQGSQKKSYAAAALGLSSNTAQSSQPLISSSDPTVQESLENERNGN